MVVYFVLFAVFCVVFIDWLLGLVLFVLLSFVDCLVERLLLGRLVVLLFRVIILGSCVDFAVFWCCAGLFIVRFRFMFWCWLYFVGFWVLGFV